MTNTVLLEKLNNFLKDESYQKNEEIIVYYEREADGTPNKMVEFTTLSGRKALMYTINGNPLLVIEKVAICEYEPFYENIMKCVRTTESTYHETPCIDIETGRLFCMKYNDAWTYAEEEDNSELIENLELLQLALNE